MITLGIIVSILGADIKVRLPIFEAAGSNENQILNCSLCYNPGNINSYKANDVVYVGFENNQIDKPVILGKLYAGEEKEASNYSFSNSLKVTENASLPYNTTIGDLNFSKIKNIFNEIDQLNDYVVQLRDMVYPVGSIYISVNEKSPALLFGGAWERIKDKFLLSDGDSYIAGNEGGSSTYSLRAAIGAYDDSPRSLGYVSTNPVVYQSNHKTNGYKVVGSTYENPTSSTVVNHSTPVVNGDTNSATTTILPPYVVVYMWKRVL